LSSVSLLCPRLIAHHSSYTHGAHAREICQIDYLGSKMGLTRSTQREKMRSEEGKTAMINGFNQDAKEKTGVFSPRKTEWSNTRTEF